MLPQAKLVPGSEREIAVKTADEAPIPDWDWLAPIPNGRENPPPRIHLFDERPNRAPTDASKYVIFLCASLPLHGSPRYAAALGEIVINSPNGAQYLFAHEVWRDADHWRKTYREVLAEVTHCYVLCNTPYAAIAAGAWAELLHLTRPGSSLCYLAAFIAPNADSQHSLLKKEGYFEPVPLSVWRWTHVARLHLKKARSQLDCAEKSSQFVRYR
jgi:hypothetical protein